MNKVKDNVFKFGKKSCFHLENKINFQALNFVGPHFQCVLKLYTSNLFTGECFFPEVCVQWMILISTIS